MSSFFCFCFTFLLQREAASQTRPEVNTECWRLNKKHKDVLCLSLSFILIFLFFYGSLVLTCFSLSIWCWAINQTTYFLLLIIGSMSLCLTFEAAKSLQLLLQLFLARAETCSHPAVCGQDTKQRQAHDPECSLKPFGWCGVGSETAWNKELGRILRVKT